MAIRKRPSKKNRNGYVYQYYFDHKDKYGIKKRYSKSGFRTKKEAERAEIEQRESLEKNANIKANKMTFGDCYNLYLNSSNIKETSKNTYSSVHDKHLSWLDCYEMKYIDDELFEDRFEDLSRSMQINVVKVINNVFKFANRKGYVNRVSFDFDFKDEKKKDPMIVNHDQFMQILSLTEEITNGKQLRMMLLIGYYSGMRISEVCGLMKSDIDLVDHTFSIKRQLLDSRQYSTLKTKNSNNVIPIANVLIDELESYLDSIDHEELFLSDKGDLMTRKYMNRFIEIHVKKIRGLEDFHFHCLRHSLVTNLVRAGAEPKAVQMIARHANIQTTLDIYTHLEQNDLRKSLDSVFDVKCANFVSKNTNENILN